MENLKLGKFDPMPGLMLSKMAKSLKDNNSFPPPKSSTTLYDNYFLSLSPQTSLGPQDPAFSEKIGLVTHPN